MLLLLPQLVSTGPFAVMLVVGRRLMRGLLKTRLGEAIAELRTSAASDERIAAEEKKYEVEFGENIGPITEFGASYGRGQLYTLFKYVGRHCLGLPAFGPNILRSMHVTAVLIKAIDQGKKYDDPEKKRYFRPCKTWPVLPRTNVQYGQLV